MEALMKKKIKTIIKDLENKINTLKSLQLKESDRVKEREINGMIEGFEYSLSEVKKLLPRPVTKKELILAIIGAIAGITMGILLGVYLKVL